MIPTLIIARHAVLETVHRRVFAVVLVLTLLFLALFTVASAKAFAAQGTFQFGNNGPVGPAGSRHAGLLCCRAGASRDRA